MKSEASGMMERPEDVLAFSRKQLFAVWVQ
jgi:hypothetical protein